MADVRPKLPDFEHPPINEVVLSIQFSDVPFMNAHAGLLWQRVRETYPKVEEQQPIFPPTFETFGAPNVAQNMQLQFSMQPDILRYWFLSADENQLLQIQRDRVIHNWRQKKSDDDYPRYESVKQNFEAELAIVQKFFHDEGWGDIRPNQCEVSYINIIGPNEVTQTPNRDLAEIFTFWNEKYSDRNLSHIERGAFAVAFLILGDDGKEPVGRLHIDCRAAVRKEDSKPVLRLALTARGRPEKESLSAALAWLDKGRREVVQGFASITTKKMHEVWGRKRS
jgi:uncharacterized protein (TIGR04255 family)